MWFEWQQIVKEIAQRRSKHTISERFLRDLVGETTEASLCSTIHLFLNLN